MVSTDTNNWYEKYTGFPYKHLGNNPVTGIDCFNLCRHVYEQELHIQIPYMTSDFCNIIDEDWYSKSHEKFFDSGVASCIANNTCIKVDTPQCFDVLFFSIGSTNVTNHCALYVGDNKLLQTMLYRKSWISPYGRYYKQYETGIYRWIS